MHYACPGARGIWTYGHMDIWTKDQGPRTMDPGPHPHFERQRQPLSHWGIQKLDNFVHRPSSSCHKYAIALFWCKWMDPRNSGSRAGPPPKAHTPKTRAQSQRNAPVCAVLYFLFLRGLPLWVVEVCGGGGLLMALCGANFHKNVPNISLYMEHAAPHPDPHPQSLFAAVACVQALLLTAGWPRSPHLNSP